MNKKWRCGQDNVPNTFKKLQYVCEKKSWLIIRLEKLSFCWIKHIMQNVDKTLQFLCDLKTSSDVFRRAIWIESHQNLLFLWSSTYLKSLFGNGTDLQPHLLTYQFSFILAKQKWRLGVWFSGRQNVVIGW
jgi:hypothetical protein